MRRGKLSKYECQFIKDNVQNMDYVAIANTLERKHETIRKYIENKLGMTVNLSIDTSPVSLPHLQYDIEHEAFWEAISDQFSEPELKIFKYQWNQFFEQFGGDVLPTEKLQIIDTIKLEVLMNRNLREQMQSANELKDVEIEIEKEKSKPEDPPPDGRDPMRIMELERQISFNRGSHISMGKDYRELQDRKNKMLTAIKGTREQRIKRIENSSESFLTWMSEIISDPDKRRELGKRMEKLRLSTIDETIRLAAYHKYEDGNIDRPFLNCDTVTNDDGRQVITSVKSLQSQAKEEAKKNVKDD